MNDIKKNIRRIFYLFAVLFACVVLYLGNYILFGSAAVITNAYNPRLKMTDETVERGKILDAKGNILASGNSDNREYPYARKLAHLVGTTQMGRTGVEAKYNFDLQRPHLEIFQRITALTQGTAVSGNSAVLTIDADLQNLVYKALNEMRGAVVVMEPSTGKILSMVSDPSYNPQEVAENWECLKTDVDNSPLLNRATQGMYPPGSVFKVLTAAAGIESGYSDFTFECEGEAVFSGEKIRCFDSKKHGHVDMTKAMAVSCNTYFSALAIEIGAEKLQEICRRAYFNQDVGFPVERSKSSFVLNANSSTGAIIQTAIGQGQTQVTPLNMAMIASAIANKGVMMKPYVLQNFVDFKGSVSGTVLPAVLSNTFTSGEALALTEMMISTVKEGTAKNAAVKNITVAAKTGTAENSQGDDHGWVIAFAPAENPEIAIAVVLENSGGPRKALELVKKVVEGYKN